MSRASKTRHSDTGIFRERVTAGVLPLILYSAGSWLFPLLMLSAEDALDPTVSTLSKLGLLSSSCSGSRPLLRPGLFANGLRIGIVRPDGFNEMKSFQKKVMGKTWA